MPKKSKGGNRHKRAKNSNDQNERQNMVYREEGEEYAVVEKMVGGGRCQIILPDQSTKLAIIRGKLRRRSSWISVGDLVLVSIRGYQDDKCDVIHKYTMGQIQILKKKSSLPDGFLSKFNKTETSNITNPSTSYEIEFKDESDSESDDDEDESVVSFKKKESVVEESSESEDNDDSYAFNFDEI